MSKNEDGKNVVYRRINGRIVPIKVSVRQPVKKLSSAEISDAVTDATVAGAAAFAGAKKYQSLFGRAATRIDTLLSRVKHVIPNPPVNKTLVFTKTGKMKTKAVTPDMFQMAKYSKEKKVFSTRLSRISRLKDRSKMLRLKSKAIGKFIVPFTVAAAALSAAGSLGIMPVDND